MRLWTYTQHWDNGARMDISSLECFPNLSKHKNAVKKLKNYTDTRSKKHAMLQCPVLPSCIVQVEKKSFVPKFGKNLIVVSVHVACDISESRSEVNIL